MQKEKNSVGTRLKTWLFNKPVVFMFSFLGLCLGSCLLYSLVEMIFNIETVVPVFVLCGISFALAIYYMLRKLPHQKMSQSDFVAIVNGATLISLVTSFVTIFIASFYDSTLQFRMNLLFFLHTSPILFFTSLILVIMLSLYLVGVAISGIYAKYLRSTTLGISPWKVILSMPFAFLMMWTPGYLIKGKDTKSELSIKCDWYSKFNKWTLANFNNLMFVFLFLLFFKNIISGLATFVLSVVLLIIYTLWYVKHKSDFLKNINKSYAATAVYINLAIILAIIVQLLR